MRDLTGEEKVVLGLSGALVNAVGLLPPTHDADWAEFAFHMHCVQNIILARPATEEYAESMVRE